MVRMGKQPSPSDVATLVDLMLTIAEPFHPRNVRTLVISDAKSATTALATAFWAWSCDDVVVTHGEQYTYNRYGHTPREMIRESRHEEMIIAAVWRDPTERCLSEFFQFRCAGPEIEKVMFAKYAAIAQEHGLKPYDPEACLGPDEHGRELAPVCQELVRARVRIGRGNMVLTTVDPLCGIRAGIERACRSHEAIPFFSKTTTMDGKRLYTVVLRHDRAKHCTGDLRAALPSFDLSQMSATKCHDTTEKRLGAEYAFAKKVLRLAPAAEAQLNNDTETELMTKAFGPLPRD